MLAVLLFNLQLEVWVSQQRVELFQIRFDFLVRQTRKDLIGWLVPLVVERVIDFGDVLFQGGFVVRIEARPSGDRKGVV